MSNHKYTRRNFIGTIPCLTVGTATLFSSLGSLKAMNSFISNSTSIQSDDYKAIVCILLAGGNDSYNMIIPRGTTEYNEYATVRSNQAIPKEQLLPINPITSDGKEYGLHPNLTGLQQLFNEGKLAFINNVGTLVEPTTKTMFQNGSANKPLGLLSHSDQVMHWQTALPQDRSNQGWGGRMADILHSMNDDSGVSMNISLGGNNLFQRGEESIEYAINNDGGVSIYGWNEDQVPFLSMMRNDVTSMMEKQYNDLYKDSYAGVLKRSIESNEFFNTAIENITPITTSFSPTELSQDLKMVASSIAAREELGAKRQIYFVEIGGFDNHDEMLNNHGLLMKIVNDAMSEFYAATEELGLSENITTYTISDFARTLTSNGNGTDHAWGGNSIVMGGAVRGRDMYGTYPDLGLGSDQEIGGGIILPTTSTDLYFAEIALWFGISRSELSDILPNLGNFHNIQGTEAPLGFLV